MRKLQHAEGGGSGAIIYFTHTQDFVIKTINKAERDVFFRILDGYMKRISEPGSRLARIIGVYRLKPIDQDFIIMENLLSDKENAVSFDIKGSSLDRLVSGDFNYLDPPYGRVLKDLNLKESGFQFNMQQECRDELMSELNRDFEILAGYGIMDYSVFIAFYKNGVTCKTRYDIIGCERVYSIGIIDFFQMYTIQKRSETYLKKLLFRNEEISSEQPLLYKIRIVSSIGGIMDSQTINPSN